MTDARPPVPSRIILGEQTVLTEDQQVRVEALNVARHVLVNRTFGGAGAAHPLDLIAIARFIADGHDPYAVRAVIE